jgi:glycosyltransferase involved in cell wall biosynthesis
MNEAKISIITVSFNAKKTIFETIESVNNQTYKNIEYIVLDGKSTDQTLEIIEKTKKIPGLVKSEKDRSTEDAMNKSLRYATGEIIFYLNADDFLSDKNIISKVMEKFNQNKNIDIVYGNIEYFSHIKKKLTGRKFTPGKYIYGSYLKGWHAPHPGFFIKKKYYEKFGGFNENIKICPDFEIMFRFQELNKLNSCYLNKTITYMGTGGQSTSMKSIIIGNYFVIKSLLLHKQKIFIPLFLYRRLFPKILDKFLLFLKIK